MVLFLLPSSVCTLTSFFPLPARLHGQNRIPGPAALYSAVADLHRDKSDPTHNRRGMLGLKS
jgi:hypothetical protein